MRISKEEEEVDFGIGDGYPDVDLYIVAWMIILFVRTISYNYYIFSLI